MVLYHHSNVYRVDEFEAGEEIVFSEKIASGGTDFRPTFERIEKEGYEPACLVYLTDLCGPAPDSAPGYPVLWVSTTDTVGPWGETVRLEI